MLFRLLLFRLLPVVGLKLLKERTKIKWSLLLIVLLYSTGTAFLIYGSCRENGWYGIALLLPALFPQYLFYGFACWLLLRCVFYSWSERVWNRIYLVSICTVILGILTENYWNPAILTFFEEILLKI